MASMQIQKTQTFAQIANKFPKTVLQQKQSLEVVQTMLLGGLSSIAYLREFFKENVFEKQIYELQNKIHSYKDLAAGRLARRSKKGATDHTKMPVMQRGRSRRVDAFLDWLERDAFAALAAGNLHALQIYVHADPADRQKVIETYTFTIKYLPERSSGREVAGLELDSPGSSMVSVGNTNAHLQHLLRNINSLCESLPMLPEKRFVSMSMLYVNEVRKPILPPGWIPGCTDQLLFAGAEDWMKQTQGLEPLSSGYHNSTVTVSSLTKLSSASDIQLPTVPDVLQYTTTIARFQDVVSEDADKELLPRSNLPSIRNGDPADVTATFSDEGKPEEGRAPSARTRTASQRLNTRLNTAAMQSSVFKQPPGFRAALAEVAKSSRSPSKTCSSPAQPTEESQMSNVVQMRNDLNGMMQHESISQGDTQMLTQAYLKPARSETTEATFDDVSPPRAVNGGTSKPALSQSVAKRLTGSEKELRAAASTLAKPVNKEPGADLVLCQCEFSDKEGAMIKCVYCNTLQHLHCYGYTGDDDARLPTKHVCYRCLLGRGEEETLKSMHDLAQKRRGMHYAQEHGLRTQTAFLSESGFDASVAGTVYKHLKGQGYVTGAPGSRTAGFSASGRPHFLAVTHGEAHEKMLRNLFDPLTNISHHYELDTKQAAPPAPTFKQRLQSNLSNPMPPPASPASQLHKRLSAATPTPGSNLRASQTPFETPSRSSRSERLESRKRAREDVDLDEGMSLASGVGTPGSANKRVKWVQTMSVIDVNGLSSPAEFVGR